MLYGANKLPVVKPDYYWQQLVGCVENGGPENAGRPSILEWTMEDQIIELIPVFVLMHIANVADGA